MDRDFRKGYLEIDFPTQPFGSPLPLLRDSLPSIVLVAAPPPCGAGAFARRKRLPTGFLASGAIAPKAAILGLTWLNLCLSGAFALRRKRPE